MIVRVRVLISGRVQGVFFRANTKGLADELGLKGFVRNTRDAGVEVVAEGEEHLINELIAFLHKGPAGALVTSIQVINEKPTAEFNSFEIAY